MRTCKTSHEPPPAPRNGKKRTTQVLPHAQRSKAFFLRVELARSPGSRRQPSRAAALPKRSQPLLNRLMHPAGLPAWQLTVAGWRSPCPKKHGCPAHRGSVPGHAASRAGARPNTRRLPSPPAPGRTGVRGWAGHRPAGRRQGAASRAGSRPLSRGAHRPPAQGPAAPRQRADEAAGAPQPGAGAPAPGSLASPPPALPRLARPRERTPTARAMSPYCARRRR